MSREKVDGAAGALAAAASDGAAKKDRHEVACVHPYVHPRKEGYCTAVVKVPDWWSAMRIYFGLTLLTASLFPTAASAQTDRRVGVTLGQPAQVGVMRHITHRVAVRPELKTVGTAGTIGAVLYF